MYVMLSSLVIKRKDKHKIVCIQINKRIIVNLMSNNTKDYRCTFKNNTRDLIQKFNFVIKIDFVKLVKNNSDEIFEIIKHLLTTYYIMNEISRSLQKKLTLTIIDNN